MTIIKIHIHLYHDKKIINGPNTHNNKNDQYMPYSQSNSVIINNYPQVLIDHISLPVVLSKQTYVSVNGILYYDFTIKVT